MDHHNLILLAPPAFPQKEQTDASFLFHLQALLLSLLEEQQLLTALQKGRCLKALKDNTPTKEEDGCFGENAP